MEAFLVSIVVVAVGEIGDKTQLLALLLAARFRRPLPIVLGILVATLANHALAAALGAWVREIVPAVWLRWLLAGSFLGVALWALKPDRVDERRDEERGAMGAFAVTAVSFFLTEIGDKTQIATVMLAAQFGSLAAVVAGTTLGLLVADVPAVWLGRVAAARIPLRAVRLVAAALFAALAIVALVTG
ncbi:MAG TPA: TMEM165/GDT1 family protein [Casimicrobiaceae bacterium]